MFEFLLLLLFCEIASKIPCGYKSVPVSKSGTRRGTGNIRIVTVKVLESNREYSYLAGNRSYYEGDLIEVPFGKDNDIRIAEVVDTDYVFEDELPVPLYKMKYAGEILTMDVMRQFENHMP